MQPIRNFIPTCYSKHILAWFGKSFQSFRYFKYDRQRLGEFFNNESGIYGLPRNEDFKEIKQKCADLANEARSGLFKRESKGLGLAGFAKKDAYLTYKQLVSFKEELNQIFFTKIFDPADAGNSENAPTQAAFGMKHYQHYSQSMKKAILDCCQSIAISYDDKYHGSIASFLHGFEKVLFVYPPLNNERIRRQQDAFLLYSPLASENLGATTPKQSAAIIIKKDSKKDILEELDDLGISRSFLFPELEVQAEDIQKLYLSQM